MAPPSFGSAQDRLPWAGSRLSLAAGLAVALAVALVGWTVIALLAEDTHFAVLAPRAQAALEGTGAFARLFGALVLVLCATRRTEESRLQWVACGLLVSGAGGMGFGALESLLGGVLDLNAATYGSLAVWTVAGTCFAVGLATREVPPRLGPRWLAVTLVMLCLFSLVAYGWADLSLPPLVLVADPFEAASLGGDLPGTTSWHWILSSVPLGLAAAAALGTVVRHRGGAVPGWLPLAMVLFAGSQLFNALWPSTYSSVLTLADVLRFAFAAVVLVGGVLELGRLADEREALLAEERERMRRLGELATLKADFTAMVAHELGNPVAAIARLADALEVGADDPEIRSYALGALREEAGALKTLVSDVRESATAEREDFRVEVRPVELPALLEDARLYARSLPGSGRIDAIPCEHGPDVGGGYVLADPGRVGQVLRNLLSNAVKYSPDGAPVEIRAATVPANGPRRRVLVEVADGGFGISPDEIDRALDKHGRCGDTVRKEIPGTGLGLYISRRILLAHGTDLAVRSAPGEGSVFSFELELAGAATNQPASGGRR